MPPTPAGKRRPKKTGEPSRQRVAMALLEHACRELCLSVFVKPKATTVRHWSNKMVLAALNELVPNKGQAEDGSNTAADP